MRHGSYEQGRRIRAAILHNWGKGYFRSGSHPTNAGSTAPQRPSANLPAARSCPPCIPTRVPGTDPRPIHAILLRHRCPSSPAWFPTLAAMALGPTTAFPLHLCPDSQSGATGVSSAEWYQLRNEPASIGLRFEKSCVGFLFPLTGWTPEERRTEKAGPDLRARYRPEPLLPKKGGCRGVRLSDTPSNYAELGEPPGFWCICRFYSTTLLSFHM